jgi:cytochrome oxidase Cu insertion factor (SCO1/SenC/PrrC family)
MRLCLVYSLRPMTILFLAFLLGSLFTACEIRVAPQTTTTPTPAVNGPQVGSQVGNIAPDFTLTKLDGDRLDRDELLKDGKLLLIYFFATW